VVSDATYFFILCRPIYGAVLNDKMSGDFIPSLKENIHEANFVKQLIPRQFNKIHPFSATLSEKPTSAVSCTKSINCTFNLLFLPNNRCNFVPVFEKIKSICTWHKI
jgi:hypothetical protein